MSNLLPVADYLDEISKLIRTPAAPPTPLPINLTDAAISLVKPFLEQKEGDRLKAYQDIGGHWTIGYGHTMGVTPGMVITQEQADALLGQDMMSFANSVLPLLTRLPSVPQYGAMLSLAYNIGLGGFKGSLVLQNHNAGKTAEAAKAFLSWDKAHVNGELVVVPGLLKRRQDERTMYLKG